MRRADIEALRRKKRRPVDEGVRHECAIASNVLDRQFDAQGPNCRWAADFTYVDTAEGWLFLAVVMDLYSRRIVGWSMKPEMTAQLVMDALTMALWRRGRPAELLHHSDQGSQYTSEDFQRLLAHHGIACSMSRKGDCWDNAAVESFFASLKKERIYPRPRYHTRDEARADLFDYIEPFYNVQRRHSTLGQLSPVEFEQRFSTQCT
jgi:putative transposase